MQKIDIEIEAFEKQMLSAPFEQTEPLPPKKIKREKTKMFGTFSAKTIEGKDAFWRPQPGRYYRDSYMNYFQSAYEARFGEKLTNIDEVSRRFNLEYNELRNCGVIMPQGGRIELPPQKDYENMALLRRVFGYLAETKEGSYPALEAVKEKLTKRGYNSPVRGITVLTLAMGSKCWNPAKINRAVYAAREAAYRKHNYRCSLMTAARAVEVVGVHSPGKAATVAYAISMGLPTPASYREARDFVLAVITARTEGFQTVDGEEIAVLPGDPTIKLGVTRHDTVSREGWRHRRAFMFRAGSDSYHTTDGSFPRAIRALRQKRAARETLLKIEKIIKNGDSCPLIYLEDSSRAGNCLHGTEAFMREYGLKGKIASLEKVYKIAEMTGNTFAMNAVKEAVKQIA